MSAEAFVLTVLGVVVAAYAVTGGADFGGGVWDLLARGKRARAQRRAIEKAIGPIWEANHIWMIFAVVLLFSAFPNAFAAVLTAMHVPILVALLGIVFRGTAFTFRAYGMEPDDIRKNWGQVFAWSSAITPVVLGMVLGGLGTGEVRIEDGHVVSGFFAGWTSAFALGTGVFALVLFSMLAAVYMANETSGPIQELFRRRAIGTELVAGFVAAGVAGLAWKDAPQLFEGLVGAPWSLPVQVATAACAGVTLWALWKRRYPVARVFAAAQVALVVLGWGLAMDGHLVLPDMPLEAAGARAEVLRPMLWVLGIGTVVLAPALWALFRVFKGQRE